MLSNCVFAFLVMTAEDEGPDLTFHARPNVIHEIGLFQDRLGPRRAIVMVEEGCSEFSNISGLSQIRFPRGNIGACFEEVRRLLEREGLDPTGRPHAAKAASGNTRLASDNTDIACDQTSYESRSPRVFISYSHDSEAHETRVLDLANHLREDGIDANLEQYEYAPAEGWPAWCEACIKEADYVLLVCTERYFRRVQGEEEPDRWEARIIRQMLYNAGTSTRKFVRTDQEP